MKNLLLIITLLWTSIVLGQQNCNCDVALGNLIDKIEHEYPGFDVKTKDKVTYNSFKKQLLEEVKNTEPTKCFDVLKKYTSFFRDGHIWINPAGSIDKKGPVSADFVTVNIEKFQKKIKSLKDPVEGIWKNKFISTGGVTYEIGITKNEDKSYTGFVITSSSGFWKPRETKFKLLPDGKFEFYLLDKTLKTGNYEIIDNSIIYLKELRVSFVKDTPRSNLSELEIKRKVGELNGFGIKKMSKKTTLITLPSFDYPFVEIIEDMVDRNRSLIENSENLILDIRGNSGGTDNSYQKLLPYMMTNSIRTMGVEYLATKTLIDGLESYIKTAKDNPENKSEIEMIRRWIGLFEKNMGKFVNVNETGSSFSVQEIELAKISPKNVIVLIDKGVGSSAENLVIKAKQSKKVKVIGTVTSGGLDYAAARIFDFGCPEYQLRLPTFRSLRLPDYPVDNIGIQPDIYLDKTITDWIGFTVGYLEN